jgi:hypothetical protein
MKKILLFSLSLVVAVGAFAQGTINFNNNVTGQLTARIYDLSPEAPTVQKRGNPTNGVPAGTTAYTGAALSGTGYVAELWGLVGGGAAEASLEKLASSTFRTGTGAGILFGNLSTAVPNTPSFASGGAAGGYIGTFQIRAWNVGLSGPAATWATVMNSAVIPHGSSVLVTSGQLGGTGNPPVVTPNLTGLTSFNLVVVPEPSAIALGVLGLGTLMFLRRRKN